MATIERDSPLTLNWQCDPSLIDQLGLHPKTARRSEAMSGVLGALSTAAETDRWVSYSRNRNRYSGQQRYYGDSFTYRYVISAVDELDRAGLIEHQKAKAISGCGWQSRMRASPRLIEAASRNSVLHYCVRELLRLKDGAQLIPYTETAETTRRRREVQELNNALASLEVDLPGVRRTARHFWLDDNPVLITPQPAILAYL